MQKTFHLTIASPHTSFFDGEAISVTLPGQEGDFTVLGAHTPFVTVLREGSAFVRTNAGEEKTFEMVQGAVVEVSRNVTTVLL